MPESHTIAEMRAIYKSHGYEDLYTWEEFIERMIEKGWVVEDE